MKKGGKDMSYWKLYFHFVWGTKNRLPLIDSVLEPELYRAIAAKAQKLGGFMHAIGGIEDHVHFAVSIPPKVGVARTVINHRATYKGGSSRLARFSGLRTDSMDVDVRADITGRTIWFTPENTKTNSNVLKSSCWV